MRHTDGAAQEAAGRAIPSPRRTAAGDGGVEVVYTDTGTEAVEWVRSAERALGGGSGKHLHLGSRLQKQLEGDKEVWAMQGH